jgi:hypothetical protein
MSYCRKCGAKLDDGARFCRVCGTPVEVVVQSAPRTVLPARKRSTHFLILVAILIGVLLIAFFFVVFAFAPFRSVNFSQTEVAYSVPGINNVNLNFESDVANVKIIPADLTNQLIRMEVSANGSTGLFGSNTEPLKIIFSNQTSGDLFTVTSSVTRPQPWLFSSTLKVTCNIYVDRSVFMNINAQTTVGEITLNSGAQNVTFQNITLRTTTGNIQTNLLSSVRLDGNLSISTTTGNVQFSWNNAHVSRNTDVDLTSTTGSITTDITSNGNVGGNISLNTRTTTGSINLGMNINGNVGAQITSHTSVGSVSVDVQNFNGNKSPIYSSNYPAANNFIVDQTTSTGSIHINAAYQSNSSTQAQGVTASVP